MKRLTHILIIVACVILVTLAFITLVTPTDNEGEIHTDPTEVTE